MRNRPVSRILWRLSNADGHFSAATIARRMAAKLWSCNSSQPESSPGRVFRESPLGLRFLLGLAPDGGYLSRRVTATLVRSYFKALRPAPFHHFRDESLLYRFCGPVPPLWISPRGVAVSDRPALWCPDFPHRNLRHLGATIQPVPQSKYSF